jgi:putative ABC transport system permease protein
MNRGSGFRRLLTLGTTRRSIERDVDTEMGFHIQMRIEDLMRQGKTHDDAEAQALREYGDTVAARDELASIDRRRARRGAWREWLESFGQDIRFGLRGLRSRPGYAITILLTIAIGIGANAAIFSVVDAVLLRPLPFARPERLVHLWETYTGRVDNRSEASYPDYIDWRARTKAFSDMAGYHGAGFAVGATQPMTVDAAKVTANFFDVLGVHAAIGRTFLPGEDEIGAQRVVMLSYGLWERQFAADRAIVGRAIIIDGSPATVVGVLPRAFAFARQSGAEIWAPIDRGQSWRTNRGNHWINIVARMRPGVRLDAARSDMSSVMRALALEYPATNKGRDGNAVPLQVEFTGTLRPVLLLLYAAVVVVMLVACVNVANLLLMRGADREREIAMRIALGAGKARLVRQLLTESVMLSVCGGLLGIGVARLGLLGLLGLMPHHPVRGLPTLPAITLDLRIVVYAMLLALVAGLAFGMLPAFRMAAPALHASLKSAGRGSVGGGSRTRDALVIGEIALTMLLMSGALLFGRSLARLLSVDMGFRADRIVTTSVNLSPNLYRERGAAANFFARFMDGVRQIPGVEGVALTSKLPLDWGNTNGFAIVGRPAPDPANIPTASYRVVSPDYFRTMGIDVVSGRTFSADDGPGAPPVFIVNRAFAKAYFENQNPVGQTIRMTADTLRIVGIVADVTIGKLDDPIPPTMYLSFGQNPQLGSPVVIRTSRDASQLVGELTRLVTSLDPSAAMNGLTTMDDRVMESPSVFLRRFPMFLVGAFAGTALLLAIVGIYGVVSYSAAQRTREMGIRLALGAHPGSLVMLIVRHGVILADVGIVAGAVGSLVLGRFAQALFFGVRPSDPVTYVSVAAVLAAVAVGATLLPARRATRVDPALALRGD